jgi:hypothetical protein
MKNIHLLPTDKPSRLWVNNLKRRLELESENLIGSNTAQHIYITSDEEIKEGDAVIHDFGMGYELENPCDSDNLKSNTISKIILTTDQDLIADGVQAIDDEFLEWFVKNPSCEFVEVVKTNKLIDNYADEEKDKWEVRYHIYIPKEEPKQETLEEAAQNYCDIPKNQSGDKYKFSAQDRLLYNTFIEGAKWQKEQDKNKYSEEEVLKSFDHLGFKQVTSEELNSLPYQPFITDEDGNIWVIDKEQWFEQFKKK